MGLAEIVSGKEEQAEQVAELAVVVNKETGDIQLETANLEHLTSELKRIRTELKPLKKDEERIKKLILAHPDAKAGFRNAHVEITSTQTLNLDDPVLLAALYKAKVLGEAMNMSLSIPKVRKIAERVKAVGKVLESHTGRKISTT